MSELLNMLKKDCETWISNNKEIFLNESDMQRKLASYLTLIRERKGYKYNVYREYFVPLKRLKEVAGKNSRVPISFKAGFPWEDDMFIDIVVEKDGKFAAVELKYATSVIDPRTIDKKDSTMTIFGEKSAMEVKEFIKNTSANNEKRYDYWKDVRRIEALTRFPKVVGGIALIVSNDSGYWTNPRENEKRKLDYAAFSMRNKSTRKPGRLNWKHKEKNKGKESRPAFHLDGSYTCKWNPTQIPALANKNESPFQFMITEVKKVRKITE